MILFLTLLEDYLSKVLSVTEKIYSVLIILIFV